MERGTLRQILLLTDGCSNSGVSPIQTAKQSFERGVVVNVIGILEKNQSETDSSFQEIEAIARAGGGVSQIVYKENLSQTVQAVTRQAMSQTLQGVVHKELQHIFGEERSLIELAPEKRGEVMEVVDDLGESCGLDVLILVDTSASMRSKLLTIQDALFDLSMNLQARQGANHFSVYQFPYRHDAIGVIHKWASTLSDMSVIFPRLVMSGMTPTGPAIAQALHEFDQIEAGEWMYNDELREEG